MCSQCKKLKYFLTQPNTTTNTFSLYFLNYHIHTHRHTHPKRKINVLMKIIKTNRKVNKNNYRECNKYERKKDEIQHLHNHT